MASGLPVIASNVSFNCKIVNDSVGFLARDNNEWMSAFEYCINNRSKLKGYGINAMNEVTQHFPLQEKS